MNNQSWFKKIGSYFGIVISMAIIVFIIFNIAKSIWKNFEVNNHINKLEEEIAGLERENENLKNLIVYYQTDTFKELEARRKLGMKKAGEKIAIVPENKEVIGEKKVYYFPTANQKEQNDERSNPLKWWHYLVR